MAIMSGAATLSVYRHQCDLELVALLQIVSCNDVGDVHFAPGLLQIETGRVVFARRGKWPDGERAHVAKGSGDFVGQGETQKICVLFGAQVLKGKDCNRGRIGGTYHGNWLPLRLPEENGQRRERDDGDACSDFGVGAA